MQATYQTRIEGNDEALSAYAALYGRVQRRLFAEVSSGRSAASRSAASMKRGYVREYGIPARMFNAVRVSLEGKVSGARESQLLHAETLNGMVRRAGRELAGARKKGDSRRVHQKMRRLHNLEHRLVRVEADAAAGLVRLCFGGRKLWRGRYNLEANGYASHEEWLRDWRDARSDEFFVLGSRDETAGCQLCVAGVADDGSLTLRLRLPDCLAGEYGKYLTIEGIRLAYGHEQVLAALQANLEFAERRRKHGEKAARTTSLGQAISYRFKRDAKGWRVFVTTRMVDVAVVTDKRLGAVGVDLNADHLAVAETDASGNHLRAWRVPLVTYGKSLHQAEALIGDAVASVVRHARDVGKPIVIERLDFQQKKAVPKVQPDAVQLQLRQDKGLLPLPGPPGGGGDQSGQPGLQLGDRPREVHGALRAQCPSGGCPGAGPAFARLLGAHSTPAGLPRWQRRPGRLHRTCKETCEARVDALGRDLGAVETGACSATPAGEAETSTQSRPGCREE